MNYSVTTAEKVYLRQLAKLQAEAAALPDNKMRKKLWYLHNSRKGEFPLVVMEEETFWKDVRQEFKCQSPLAREIENQLQQTLFVHNHIKDDKVIPDFYRLEIWLKYKRFGVEQKKIYASVGEGFHIDPVIEDLEEDIGKLSISQFEFDREDFDRKKSAIEEILQGILPVRTVNGTNYWEFTPTQLVVELMGTENMFCAMLDTPDQYHKLMSLIIEDRLALLKFEQENKLLFLNNENDFMGSGSYCFTDELPNSDFDGIVRPKDLWGHLNSQESVGISPAMFREFVIPYYKKIAEAFGLVYYGCCEPVSDFWENGIETLPNLRKISISPWCDEEFIAPRIKQCNYIYSRKPSPNFIGINKEFDEEAFRKYISKTVSLTKGCEVEYIFRDIYQLHGNLDKVKRAVEIVREETQR